MEFRIISETNNAAYEYKDTGIIVQGNYAKDATNGNLQNISGSCYRLDVNGNQGEFIGNFNGYTRDGEVRYTLSEMTKAQSDIVWAAIEDIEASINGTD